MVSCFCPASDRPLGAAGLSHVPLNWIKPARQVLAITRHHGWLVIPSASLLEISELISQLFVVTVSHSTQIAGGTASHNVKGTLPSAFWLRLLSCSAVTVSHSTEMEERHLITCNDRCLPHFDSVCYLTFSRLPSVTPQKWINGIS
jgi:hypothetical protein